MTGTAQDVWQEQQDDPEIRIDGRVRPDREEAYWQSVYWAQPHFRTGLSFEDYAPAYCVGYIGYAQYGGCFDDAEKSLCANWLRIKGDSRLGIQDALPAIRAAWDHAAMARVQEEEEVEDEIRADFIAARGIARSQRDYAPA